MFHTFETMTRFRLAATDMRLAANAAAALIDANENDGPARVWQRVIETGLVTTYARPYLRSNKARLPKKSLPPVGPDRELHNELLELRSEYYAHAAHTPRRYLENATATFGEEGRPKFTESWERLSTERLRAAESWLRSRQTGLTLKPSR